MISRKALGIFAVAASLSSTINVALAGCMDSDNKLWLQAGTRRTYDQLMSVMACPADADTNAARQVDAVACNFFVAKGLQLLYGVKDFSPDRNGGKWLTANEIADYVRTHGDAWFRLGAANEQQVLKDAAAGATQDQPTIAVMKGAPHGHVAIVLPGDLRHSTTWDLDVPNSAAFSLNNVQKAYVFCRLSAAFSDPGQVEIYSRVKN